MLSVDFWLNEAKDKPLEEILKSVQQDSLCSCRIIAMQKYKKNTNGQWREACISLVRAIKELEGEIVEEE